MLIMRIGPIFADKQDDCVRDGSSPLFHSPCRKLALCDSTIGLTLDFQLFWARALRIAAVRSLTCSLVQMLETWLRTVLRLMPSRSAMASLESSSAISLRTSASRSLNSGNLLG